MKCAFSLKTEINSTIYETVQRNVSVSKHHLGKRKGGWIYPPTWKLNFTRPLIRIDYLFPPQYHQAASRITEPIVTAKMFKKI